MAEDLINEVTPPTRRNKSLISIIGVGGAGGNAVNYMHSVGIEGVTFMVCNTDSQALEMSPVEVKIQLGLDGLGAGNDPVRGRDAATTSLDDVRHQLESMGTQMMFIAAGMGGGTGTGASPVIAKLAHEMGILTVAIVTLPFVVEGMTRYEQAMKGIEELREWVDSLLILNNNNLVDLYGRMSLRQAFDKANEVLANAAKGIAEIITVPFDEVNIDFADVRRVLENSGRSHMGVATATGDRRVEEAVDAALKSPLLDNKHISGAKNILLSIRSGSEARHTLTEVYQVVSCVQKYASHQNNRPTANVIWGSGSKPSLGDKLEVVIVATGFESAAAAGEDESVAVPLPAFGEGGKEKQSLGGERDHVIPSRRGSRYDDLSEMLLIPAYKRRDMFDTDTRIAARRESSREASSEVPPQNENSLF